MITNDTLCKTVVYHCRIKSENEVIPFVGDNKRPFFGLLGQRLFLWLVGPPVALQNRVKEGSPGRVGEGG